MDWIGESISETVREALAASPVSIATRDERVEAANALSLRSSVPMSLAAAVKLAEKLGIDRVVYGEFEVSENSGSKQLNVTCRVLDRRPAIWLVQYSESGPLEQLTAIENGLAWQLDRWIQPSANVSRDDFIARHPPAKLAAVESYFRGLMSHGADQQHRYFTQAYRIDPSFTNSCFQLGRMHFDNENFREAMGWLEKVPPSSINFTEAHFLLGLSRYQLSNFEGARQAFEQVSRLAPLPEIWNNLGAALSRLNRPEAPEYFRKALDADPAEADYHFNTGYLLWKKGDFEAAAERFRAALDRVPDDRNASLFLDRCQKATGPRAGDWRSGGMERLKESYEDRVGKK